MPLARELLLARIAAYRQQNFAYIYQTSHPDSPLRQLFPGRDEYLAFAVEQLAGRVQINSVTILCEEIAADQARIIFYQLLQVDAAQQETLECARLLLKDGLWLYHSSQKLLLEDYPGDWRRVGFADFDRLADKLIF